MDASQQQLWLPIIFSLVAAIIGAFIGGWMAYRGSLKATQLQLEAHERELAEDKASREREAARTWFHQYYVIEGIDRVWAHTSTLKYTSGLGYMGLRHIEPPSMPVDALLKSYDLLGCDKIVAMYAVLDLIARPTTTPPPPSGLGMEVAEIMDKLFIVLQDAKTTLSNVEINSQSDIAKIRQDASVKSLGERINNIHSDIGALITKHKGFFYRK